MIKLFEMFAGYGGASFGLKKAGIDFECVGTSEIDNHAMQCYSQNHKGYHYGDCSKIDTKDLPDFDLLTGGFPCQDVSIAGNRDLSKGRTNLYSEILRIAEDKKPKYILLENVKGLLSVEINERKLVHKIVADLQKLGYGVVWKVLDSKDYGIPQSRERIWFVCKLGGWNFMEFMFPNKEELKILLKDILEEEVDAKYYLKREQIDKIIKTMVDKNENYFTSGKIYSNNDCGNANRIFKPEGISQSIQASTRTKIICNNRQPFISASRGRNKKNPSDKTPGNNVEQRLEPRLDGITNTITSVQKDNYVCMFQRPHGANNGGERAKDGVCPSITSGASWEHNNLLFDGFFLFLPLLADINGCLLLQIILVLVLACID